MIGASQFLTRDVVFAAAVFGALTAAWTIAILIWHIRHIAREKKIEQRLQPSTQGGSVRVLRLWHDGQEVAGVVPKETLRPSLIHRLEQVRRDAGWVSPLRTVLTGLMGGTLLLFIVPYAVTGRVLAGACGSMALLLLFWAYVSKQISRRQTLFEMQLVDALELAARSLRAGHPLLGSFRLIGEEIAQPVGLVFAEICQQQAMGLSLEQAVKQMAQRSSSSDIKLFGTSVVIQLRSGGNLSDMMDRLALVVRDRIRLSRRVRVLTSQTQFSKRILIALPFVFFLLLNLANPRYMEPLYTTYRGQMLLVIGGCMLLVGIFVMNRMVRPR